MEVKDVLAYLGIEAEDLDGLKSAISQKFVAVDQISEHDSVKKLIGQNIGKSIGTVITSVKRDFKNAGIEFSKEEFEGKTAEEVVALGIAKLTEQAQTFNRGKGVEEIEAKYKQKLTDYEQKVGDLSQLLNSTKTDFETYKGQVHEEKLSYKRQMLMDDALKQVKWGGTVNEYTKKGFLADISSKYKVDFDDSGNEIIRDKDGKAVANPDKAGEFIRLADLIKVEASKAELVEKNPQQGKPTSLPVARPNNDAPVAGARQMATPRPIMNVK